MSERLSITPLGPYIGAQVSGADLTRPLSDNQFEQLYHAVLRHQVVFLREQNITPAQQRDLALRFGDLHIHPVYPHARGWRRLSSSIPTTIIRRIMTTGIPMSPLSTRRPPAPFWRRKSCRRPAGTPCGPAASPPGSAVRTFPAAAERPACRTRFPQIVPEYKYNKTEAEHRRWQEAVAKHPPLLHPVVRTHPVTGKQALFVNEGFTTRIVEVSEKESAALLNFLFAHVTKPEFQVRWRWQPNDVAIWDNRVTQHYANADYLPQRRIMHRATILGDKPYYRAG